MNHSPDADWNRLLPLRTPTAARFDGEAQTWSSIVVEEVSDAREISPENFDALATRAMTIFLNEERPSFDLHMVLDSAIFDWVNAQVRLSSLIPTQTPVPAGQLGQSGLQQLGP